MKKVITIAIMGLVMLTVVHSQPIESTVVRAIVKIDDQTCVITTTTTTETMVLYNRAELQTELDHIPDRKAEIQEQLDAVNEREVELIEILEIFK